MTIGLSYKDVLSKNISESTNNFCEGTVYEENILDAGCGCDWVREKKTSSPIHIGTLASTATHPSISAPSKFANKKNLFERN